MATLSDIFNQLIDTVSRLAALEARTEDVARANERVDERIGSLLDRLSRLEAQVAGLRDGVRNEILGELQGKLAEARIMVDLVERGVIVPTKTKGLGS